MELKDFEKWFQRLNNSEASSESEKEDNYLEFVWAIMKSPYLEYHYALMTQEDIINENFRKSLWQRFDEHHQAKQLLLSKLDNNEDIKFHPDIIFLLGRMVDRKGDSDKDKVLEYARDFSLSSNGYLRDRAIIVLGWIGRVDDVPLLEDRLLNDSDSKCRSWAASSFMQLSFRIKSETLINKVLPILNKAIQKETNDFALRAIIEVVKELTNKRFGITQKAIDSLDKETMDSAKIKIIRFLNKSIG